MASLPMKKSLILILGFLFVLCVAAFAVGSYLNSAAAFALSGAALLPFVGIFAVGILDYKVGGNQLTLEKRMNSLEQENTELKESVTALIKSMYAMSDGASRWDGPTEAHHNLVSQYLAPITHLVAADAKGQVMSDIAKLFPQDAVPVKDNSTVALRDAVVQ